MALAVCQLATSGSSATSGQALDEALGFFAYAYLFMQRSTDGGVDLARELARSPRANMT